MLVQIESQIVIERSDFFNVFKKTIEFISFVKEENVSDMRMMI
jgi:hypothetical protein